MVDAPPAPPPDDAAGCPPPAACPPPVEKRKHKHVARRARRPAEPPVENVVVVGPESQFVPVPSRPVFGSRYDPRSMGETETPPAQLPIDVQPQVMPSPQGMPPAPSDDTPPKPANAGTASKRRAPQQADLTSSLQILK